MKKEYYYLKEQKTNPKWIVKKVVLLIHALTLGPWFYGQKKVANGEKKVANFVATLANDTKVIFSRSNAMINIPSLSMIFPQFHPLSHFLITLYAIGIP